MTTPNPAEANAVLDVESLVGLKWTEIRARARQLVESRPANACESAMAWYNHPAWEVRMYAVLILGGLAGSDVRALTFLFERCGDDTSWQVNEGLAMAFDAYCASIGYEAALPTIDAWLHSPRPNVRRAVSEGLRPWTARGRAYFAAHPEAAIDLLGTLRDDDSRYVQESTGNALRDISRKHLLLVLSALQTWIDERPGAPARRTIAKFALENAVKTNAALRRVYERNLHPTKRPVGR